MTKIKMVTNLITNTQYLTNTETNEETRRPPETSTLIYITTIEQKINIVVTQHFLYMNLFKHFVPQY